MTITWDEIREECWGEGYKHRFVAIFRKYEGASTDERDGSNRVIKVTEATFADHMGIPRQTFRDWVRREVDTDFVSTSATKARTAVSHANVIKNMAKNDPQALASAVLSAGTAASDQAFHELKLQRAGVDTSKANRKAADAGAHAQTEPIRRAMATAHVPLCVAALNEAKEDLQKAMEEGGLTDEGMAQIDAALEAFQFVLTEARFLVS